MITRRTAPRATGRGHKARMHRGTGLLAATLAGLLAGCNQQGGTVERLNPRASTYLDGVPVPARFELVEKMTEDYESGGQRTARHLYSGFSDPQAVRNFYREQMPLLGWNRVSDQNVKGIVTLRFERKSEACTVQIEPGWLKTSIQVIVNPFNRTPTEPPKRPIP